MKKFNLSLSLTHFHKSIYTLLSVFCLLFILAGNTVQAQLSFTNGLPTNFIDFSNTTPVTAGSNPSTAFAGAGFSPNPAVAGRLNSNAWASTGWTDGALTFGGTQVTASTDYTRLSTGVAITQGGFYAYTGAPGSVANPSLMIQPGGSDFTPGTMTLKMQNNGTSIINQMAVSYKIYVRNDQSRSQSFNLSYSYDDVTYTPVPAFDYATPAVLDALGWVLGASMTNNITAISIPPSQFFYIRWSSDDVSGSGSRDEIGLDDINLTANYPGACTPPTINATLNAFTNVLSTQMDVNFTRGNGTGGIIVVASPAALTQNPISGITYTANPNYGSGQSVAPGNGFVVYRGPAAGPLSPASFTMTGLTAGTTYTINLFEYDVTIPCYTVAGVSGTQATLPGSITNAADLFRSKVSGNWANASTWESFTGGLWINADLAPTSASTGITIQATHTVDITSTVSMDQLTVLGTGTITLSTGGVINLNDGTGVDMDIQNGGVLKIQTTANYTTAFLRGGAATINVATGGKITVGNGSSSPGYSPLGHTSGYVIWNNGAIYEWNTTDPFITNGVTYFPDAVAGVIPIFRVSRSPSLQPGAASNTGWNGLMEVNANLTLKLAGTKTFRNGIIGTATLTQDDFCGQFIINGATASFGIFTLNLNNTLTFGLDINAASVTTMTSNTIVNAATSALFTVSAASSLYCDAYTITGTGIFSIASGCTLRLGSVGGISAAGATGNIQTTGARTINTGINFIFNGTASQVTGNGMPTAINSLTINNTGGTVTLTTTNTTSPTLTLTAGLFASGTGQQLNISTGGTVTATSGNFATGSTAGILNFQGTGTFSGTCSPYDVYASGAVNFGAGTVTIQNGGSFRINTGGSANLNAPFYATGSTLVYNTGLVFAAGTEWLTLAVSPARGGPHHVTILASGTSVNFGASGSNRSMTGDLTISSGTFFALSTAAGGDLNIAGNWTRAASGTFTNNARLVNFNSTTANQTITVTGGGTETFGYMAVNKAIGLAVIQAGAPNATSITLNGNPASVAASNTLAIINGNLDLNQNTFNFTSWNGNQNNIQIDGTTGNLTRFVNSTGGPGTFAVFNSDAATHNITIARASGSTTRRAVLSFGATVKVTTGSVAGGTGGINFGTFATTAVSNIDGILQIDIRGFVTTFPPTYGIGSTLIYNTTGAYNRAIEWSTTTGPGYPYHVTVQGAGTVLTVNYSGGADVNRQMEGNLTISNGSGLILNNAAFTYNLTIKGNLVLDGTLILPGTIAAFGADIILAGNWTRSATGVFVHNERAVFFNGAGNSTITANNGETFAYVYFTKSALAQSVLLDDDISVTKILGISTGTVNLQNKNVILKSRDTTASINKITTGQGQITYGGTGRFIVERYIPTAVGAAPNHLKSWQFLAVPVNQDIQTINAAWQEGQAPLVTGTAGLGTIISNFGAGTGGFDITTGVAPSMKTYTPLTNSWTGISGTNITHYNQKGYMLFVRGDRSVITYNGTSVATTLRTKGKIMEPANLPPVTTIGANAFESVGNPYASAIDFSNIVGVVRSGAVNDVFYLWDPRLGGVYGYGKFQTCTKSGANYLISPGGGSYGALNSVQNAIQSGQAFFVSAGAGGGTITINEDAKIAGGSLVTRQGSSVTVPVKRLNNCLYIVSGNNRTLLDAAVSEFDRAYSNGLDRQDAIKFLNADENLGIASANKILAVEHRGIIRQNDVIQYNIGRFRNAQYQFEFTAENIARTGLKAFLEDKFLGTSTPVSLTDTSRISFTITNAPGSYAPDRFRLVFVQKQNHLMYSNLVAEQTENEVNVKWETGEEASTGNYQIERSADGIHFSVIHNEPVNGSAFYSWKDSNPFAGKNYYRIHNPDPSDRLSYSNRVNVTLETPERTITVFPNPVTDAILHLKIKGLVKGDYLLKLFNSSGQQIIGSQFNCNGAIDNQSFKLPRGMSNGIYKLEITHPGGTKQVEEIFISN